MSRPETASLATLFALALATPLPTTAYQEPARDSVQGSGAAGVTEVGRPLDVLRARAERQARQRATRDLTEKILEGLANPPADERRDELRERIEERAASPDALWQVRYWTNGAVTATVTIRTQDLIAEAGR